MGLRSHDAEDHNLKSYLYVDDTKLMRDIKSEDNICKFQENLKDNYVWAHNNNMLYNDTKFVLMRYGDNLSQKKDLVCQQLYQYARKVK